MDSKISDLPVANNLLNNDFMLVVQNGETKKFKRSHIGIEKMLFNIDKTPGVIEKSLKDKFNDIVSIRDFGAIGDGVNDDTSAIQTALDFVVSNNLGDSTQLYFPSGRYIITETLDFGNPRGARYVFGGGYGGTNNFDNEQNFQQQVALIWKGTGGGTVAKYNGHGCNFDGVIHILGRTEGDVTRAGVGFLLWFNTGLGSGHSIFNGFAATDCDIGFQCGVDPNDSNCADLIFSRFWCDHTDVGFQVINNQGMNYVFASADMFEVKKCFKFDRGGNMSCQYLHVANNTGNTDVLQIGQGGINVASYIFRHIDVDKSNNNRVRFIVADGNPDSSARQTSSATIYILGGRISGDLSDSSKHLIEAMTNDAGEDVQFGGHILFKNIYGIPTKNLIALRPHASQAARIDFVNCRFKDGIRDEIVNNSVFTLGVPSGRNAEINIIDSHDSHRLPDLTHRISDIDNSTILNGVHYAASNTTTRYKNKIVLIDSELTVTLSSVDFNMRNTIKIIDGNGNASELPHSIIVENNSEESIVGLSTIDSNFGGVTCRSDGNRWYMTKI